MAGPVTGHGEERECGYSEIGDIMKVTWRYARRWRIPRRGRNRSTAMTNQRVAMIAVAMPLLLEFSAATAASPKMCPFVYTNVIANNAVLPALRRAAGSSYRHVTKPDRILVYVDKPLVSIMFHPAPYVEGTWPYTVDYNPCTHRILSAHATTPVIE
jgi:hypothetical protein